VLLYKLHDEYFLCEAAFQCNSLQIILIYFSSTLCTNMILIIYYIIGEIFRISVYQYAITILLYKMYVRLDDVRFN
jgi:hypothetical protein